MYIDQSKDLVWEDLGVYQEVLEYPLEQEVQLMHLPKLKLSEQEVLEVPQVLSHHPKLERPELVEPLGLNPNPNPCLLEESLWLNPNPKLWL